MFPRIACFALALLTAACAATSGDTARSRNPSAWDDVPPHYAGTLVFPESKTHPGGAVKMRECKEATFTSSNDSGMQTMCVEFANEKVAARAKCLEGYYVVILGDKYPSSEHAAFKVNSISAMADMGNEKCREMGE